MNSYACVPFHLGDEGYAQQGVTLANKAAKLAREASSESAHNVRVAGSLPPVFGSYRPELFQYEQAKAITTELMQAQDEYVDLWLAETVASIAEAKMYLELFNTTQKSAYLCFTLQDELEQPALLRSGETVEEAVELLVEAGGKGLFFNCSIQK